MDKSKKPLWISHRGYAERCDENTADAFSGAVQLGFKALETDLRLSKDNHIVLCHDPTLERTAGIATEVSSLTRKELSTVVLKKGGRLLFLDEFLLEFSECTWTLDIKPEQGERTIDVLAGLLRRLSRHDVAGRARFLTWRKRDELLLMSLLGPVVHYARKQQCIRAGLAILADTPVLAGIKRNRIYSLPPHYRGRALFRPEIVEAFHKRGASVLAFLPRTKEEFAAALASQFDQILTDGPPQPTELRSGS